MSSQYITIDVAAEDVSLGVCACEGGSGGEEYLNDVLLCFCNKFVLQLFRHLRVKELFEGSFNGQSALSVPLLNLVAELISVVKLLYLFIVRLVTSVPAQHT